jgi:hypothetical protein
LLFVERHDFCRAHQIGVFLSHVEKIGFVRRHRAIADAIGDWL